MNRPARPAQAAQRGNARDQVQGLRPEPLHRHQLRGGALLREAADEDHEDRHQGKCDEHDDGGRRVQAEHHDHHDRRHRHGEKQLGQVTHKVRQQVVEAAGREGRDVGGTARRCPPEPERRRMLHHGFAQFAHHARARPVGLPFLEPHHGGAQQHDLGLAHLYAGIRCTQGDPVALAADPALLIEALAGAVRQCIDEDGAEAVIIGGGPLGEAAEQLRLIFDTPVLGPIPCAVERIIGLIGQATTVSQAV